MLNRNETNRPTFSPDDKLELISLYPNEILNNVKTIVVMTVLAL